MPRLERQQRTAEDGRGLLRGRPVPLARARVRPHARDQAAASFRGAGAQPELAPVVRGIERIFPRPAVDAAMIDFGITGESVAPVRLDVYEVSGRLVRSLFDGPLEPGRHRMAWDGRSDLGVAVGSGVYFIRLRLGGEIWTEKLLLLR